APRRAGGGGRRRRDAARRGGLRPRLHHLPVPPGNEEHDGGTRHLGETQSAPQRYEATGRRIIPHQKNKATRATVVRTKEDAMRVGTVLATVAAGSLVIGVAVAGAQTPGVSDGTVKIGVLTDMAGVFSDLAGAGAVTAAQMAIDDFVEKEKPPFKVELVSADHQNKPDIATGIARQWYDTGGVRPLPHAGTFPAAPAGSPR